MASTNNKNTPGNYKAEQAINSLIGNYTTYIQSAQGEAYTNHFAGDGLLMGTNARTTLCNNYTDVESQLFGIGATNLVNPKSLVKPEIKYMQSVSIIDRLPVVVPEPLILEKNQRPQFM